MMKDLENQGKKPCQKVLLAKGKEAWIRKIKVRPGPLLVRPNQMEEVSSKWVVEVGPSRKVMGDSGQGIVKPIIGGNGLSFGSDFEQA
ncbi:hypothetical protein QYF36_015377 [Acer negundo]|nr:hypothetical protein QYF36_015377 [Acer negundo]